MMSFSLYRCCNWLLLPVIVSCTTGQQQPLPSCKTIAAATARESVTIQLLPYTGFDTTLLPVLQQTIATFYHCAVQVLPPVAMPALAWYAPRQRYKADSLLAFQQRMTSQGTIIVGCSYYDVSTRKDSRIDDWGVFGLGYCPGRACVVSTWRLRNASHSRTQLLERLCKVLLHELGHNLGLPHCTASQSCLMADAAGTLAQVDREQQQLCGS